MRPLESYKKYEIWLADVICGDVQKSLLEVYPKLNRKSAVLI